MKMHLFNASRSRFLRPLLFLLSFFFLGNYAKAQIVYQDVNPDIVGTAWNLNILGTTFADWSGGDAFATNPYDLTNPRCMIVPGTVDGVAILNQGDMIAPTSSWNGDAWGLTGITDKYLGVRIGTAGNYRYGWIKISRNAAGVSTIQSYAYQNTLNTAIAAGDMGGGQGNVAVTGIMVNGQGGASAITTNDGTLQMTAMVMPANATNQAVTWSVQNGTGTATINATGLLTAQTNGMVTVKATAQDGSNVSGTKTITISGQTTVGIKDVDLLPSSIYPNPVQKELVLQFGNEESIQYITISNLAGQVVYKDANARKGKLITVSTASLSEGMYILTFKNAAGKQGLQKFVKMK